MLTYVVVQIHSLVNMLTVIIYIKTNNSHGSIPNFINLCSNPNFELTLEFPFRIAKYVLKTAI